MKVKFFSSNDNRKRALLAVVALSTVSMLMTPPADALGLLKKEAATPTAVAPDAPPLLGEVGTTFEQAMKFGNYALTRQSFPMAADNFRAAVHMKDIEPAPHLGLGQALCGLGLQEEGMQEFFEALQRKPDFAAARFALGTVLMKRDSWDEAAGQFIQVLKLKPNDLATRGNLGICYEEKGQMDAAIEQFKYIINVDPNNVDGHYNLACAYDIKKDWDSAASGYRKVLQLHPKHPFAYTGLANVLLNKRDAKSAIALNLAAIKIYPDNHLAYIGLGRAYECLGRERDAQEQYRKAIQINPKSLECQRLMANMMKTQAKKLGLSNLPGLTQ